MSMKMVTSKPGTASIPKKQIDRFNALEVTDSTALDVYVTDDAAKRGQFKGLYKKDSFL